MSAAAIDASDGVLAAHVLAGAVGLVVGAAALAVEQPPAYRSRAGLGYVWAVAAVAITAIALVALDEWKLWWLVPLAVLALSLALAGYVAPRHRRGPWIRLYAHGQGGAYIALVTALLVVSLPAAPATAAWVVPVLIGVPLIERRVTQINKALRPREEKRMMPGASNPGKAPAGSIGAGPSRRTAGGSLGREGSGAGVRPPWSER